MKIKRKKKTEMFTKRAMKFIMRHRESIRTFSAVASTSIQFIILLHILNILHSMS